MLRAIFFDAANALSLSRIGLAMLVWARPHDPVYLVAVLFAAAATDWLDGALGRKTHAGKVGTDNVGAWLDPLCDKIFVVSAMLAIFVTYQPPLWVLPLVLLRDVLLLALTPVFRVVAGRELFHGHDFRARPLGKLTTVCQFAAFAAIVLARDFVMPAAALAGAVGLAAVIERVWLAASLLRRARGGDRPASAPS